VGGRVDLESEPGKGTTFRLLCPLTVVSEQVFLVEVSGRRTAILMSAVERLALVHAQEVRRVGGEPMLRSGDRELRLVSLAAGMGIPEWDAPKARFPALILRARRGVQPIAIRADRVIGVQDAVIKPLPRELNGLQHLSAVADVGEGRLVFVFNHETLFRARAAEGLSEEKKEGAVRATILVVDDSVTTRALHRRVLEGAGYRVIVAGNGLEALKILEKEKADLIVSDIDMPQLDGVSMLERVRASPRLTNIPAILASALAADSQRAALAKGLADAYIAKSAYERGEMIETIERLLSRGVNDPHLGGRREPRVPGAAQAACPKGW
jgi:two-component system chemotaxis sensor kinase CheA